MSEQNNIAVRFKNVCKTYRLYTSSRRRLLGLFFKSVPHKTKHAVVDMNLTVERGEAVASEPLINAIAFSVCLMRVKDGTDIDELKAEIRRSANPAKWICVDVNPNDVRVESVGDLVLLIMADDSEKYSEAFYALAE